MVARQRRLLSVGAIVLLASTMLTLLLAAPAPAILGCGINPPRDVRVRVSGGVGSRASWLKVWFAAMQCLAAHGDPTEQPSTFRPCRMYANPQIDPQRLPTGALAFTDPRQVVRT